MSNNDRFAFAKCRKKRKRKTSVAAIVGSGLVLMSVAANAAPPAQSQADLSNLLIDAVRAGNLAAVRSIVDAGTDFTRLDADGRSVMDIAIAAGKFEIVQYLMLARQLQHLKLATPSSATSPAAPPPPITLPAVARQIAAPRISTPPTLANGAKPEQKIATTVSAVPAADNPRELAETLADAAEKLAGAIAKLAEMAKRATSSKTPPLIVASEVPEDRNVNFYPTRKPEPRSGSTATETVAAPDLVPDLVAQEEVKPPAAPTGLVARLVRGFGKLLVREARDGATDERPGATLPATEKSGGIAVANLPPPAPALPLKPDKHGTAGGNAPVLPLSSIDLDPFSGKNTPGTRRAGAEAGTTPPAAAQPKTKAATPARQISQPADAVVQRSRIPRRFRDPAALAKRAEDFRARTGETQRLAARSKRLRDSRTAAANRDPSRAPLKRLQPPLKGVILTLGNSVTTGQSQAGGDIGPDWPEEVRDIFGVNMILYQGLRAVARYDSGQASHFHALYDSRVQKKVVAWAKKKFSPPTDYWRRTIAPFGKPRKPNPTYVWRSRHPKTNKTLVLEVRKFDDSRNVFPDTKHGSVRLYVAGGEPVFPTVTALDIMAIDWSARSDHVDSSAPAVANTLRVKR